MQSCSVNAIKSDDVDLYWVKEICYFVLVICIYRQSLNELQQPDLTDIFGTNNIYSFATQPCAVISNDLFSNDWCINIICSLVLSHSIFISLKYQRQTSGGCSRELTYDFMNSNHNLRPTYGCEGNLRMEKSIFQCIPTVLYALRWIRHWYYLLIRTTQATRLGVIVQKWLINISMCTHWVVCVALDTRLDNLSSYLSFSFHCNNLW